ncbi:hypothetical protein ACFOGJ_06985 [Marinibaculum pumilum]|uniref:Antifreeze glycopeptide polyprotein n=1 Tax=Marinibaculum pumilum TaxID=1766165 RepID=A0ABV7KX35_9PROT
MPGRLSGRFRTGAGTARRVLAAACLLYAAQSVLPGTAFLDGAAAQPTTLIPGLSGGNAAAPDTGSAPAPRPSAPAPQRPSGPARIEIGELDSPDRAPVGTLAPQDGAFPPAIWRDTPAAGLEPLFDTLALPTRSVALQEIRRRLLLSPASPPQGVAPETFLQWRIAALLGAGRAGDAAALAAAAPGNALAAPAMRRRAAEAAWLAGQAPLACDLTRSALLEGADPWWEKSNLLCQVADGNPAMAALTAETIAEIGDRPDPFIRAARQALNGSKVADDPALVADPLNLALFRLTGSAPPEGIDAGAGAAALAALAALPEASLRMRLPAAERAVGEGNLPPATLAGLWLEAAAGDSPAADAPARTYRTLERQIGDPGQTQPLEDSVDAMLLAGRSAGIPVAAARTATPLLARLNPERLSGDLAAETMRTFLRAGDVEEALSWWQRLRAAGADPQARRAETGIWAVLRLASPGFLPWSDADHAAWTATLADLPESRRRSREETYLALADALDLPLGPEQAAALRALPAPDTAGPAALSPGASRSPAQQRREAVGRFDTAVAARRQGEAMLAALAALLPDGPGAADLALVVHLARGLNGLGLSAEARRIAAEKALAAGL